MLSIGDIKRRVEYTFDRIRDVDERAETDETESLEMQEWLRFFRSNVLPNLSGGKAMNVVPNLLTMLYSIDRFSALRTSPPSALPDWEVLVAEQLLPTPMLTRLRSTEARLREDQITAIENAYESAERLPIYLATLAEGQRQVRSAC